MAAKSQAISARSTGGPRSAGWVPRRVLVTRSAAQRPHGCAIVERCRAAGVDDVEFLPGDRLPPLRAETERRTYSMAKATLAVVVSAPSKRRLQPIPPSADWRFDLAEGCPAHCQYCYLAGSLSGPPVTRVYADLDDILAGLDDYVGRGSVTSARAARMGEGTTFEASCYTDPLGIEHLTGSLSAAITHFGTHRWAGPVQLRATTKFSAVGLLLDLPHRRATRIRFSVNAASIAEQYEAGTDPMPDRLAALGQLAQAGYPVGLTVAPIMPVDGWQDEYASLLDHVAANVSDVADLDLTVECITHRFSPNSKAVLEGWYPRSTLDMAEERRAEKRGRFGSVKFVYPPSTMAELRTWFETELPRRLPSARMLYWT